MNPEKEIRDEPVTPAEPRDAVPSDGKGTQGLDRTEEFLQLFAMDQRKLLIYLTSMLPTRNDAEDVFQETSMVLWKEFEKFELGTNFTAWAFTIAFNRVQAWRTKRSRESLKFTDAFIEIISNEIIEHADYYHARMDALDECVKKLPSHHQELIRHRYDAGHTVESIAGHTHQNPCAVYKMLGRIRQVLHECVSRKVVA